MHIFWDTQAAAAGIADIPSFLSNCVATLAEISAINSNGASKKFISICPYSIQVRGEIRPDLSKGQKKGRNLLAVGSYKMYCI